MIPSKNHIKSEKLREEDKLEEALKAINLALKDYEKNKDIEGLCRAYQSRILVYKHLYLNTHDKKYYDQALADCDSSLYLAKQNEFKDLYSSCYFRFGEIYMLVNNYKKATENYLNAIEYFEGSKAEKGDYTYHLGEAMYKNGDKVKGKIAMFLGLHMIQKNKKGVDEFLINVWESGAFMRLAECLQYDSLAESIEYMTKAKEIIAKDKRLIIRRRQWKELNKRIIKV